MCRLLLILCCLIVAAAPPASAAPAQYAFRVTFKDKQGAPPLSANPAWLSARSVARRGKFGIALDSTDRPVSPAYVNTVLLLTQGRLHTTSRWLNNCVVLLEDSAKILQLAGQGFVSSIAWIGYFDQGLHLRVAKGGNPKSEIQRSATGTAKTTGSAAYYGAGYGQVAMVNGDYLHDLGYTGAGKLIVVLDEGFVDVDTHAGFDSLRRQGRLLETYNIVRASPSVFSNGTHGTSCLSTMAGLLPGIYVGSAPGAQYALYTTEDGAFTDAVYELDNLVAGVERADSIGADVVSASVIYNIFTSPFSTAFTKAELDGHTTIVSRAVNMAVAKGIFYTSSAGNEGGNAWDYLDSPGDADSALTVGAVNAGGAPANFSSPGPNASGRVKPDVCLLGDPAVVFGAGNNITSSGGTSFSAPQAAGYAACLMQAFPGATPYHIREAIIRSADHYTFPNAKVGYGIPNFKHVYQFLQADSPVAGEPVAVQPNPFGQSITVRLPQGAVNVDISLRDIVGRRITLSTQRTASVVTVSVASSLPQGMYVLHAIVDGKPYVIKLMHF